MEKKSHSRRSVKKLLGISSPKYIPGLLTEIPVPKGCSKACKGFKHIFFPHNQLGTAINHLVESIGEPVFKTKPWVVPILSWKDVPGYYGEIQIALNGDYCVVSFY